MSVSGEALSGGIFNFPASEFLPGVDARKTLPVLYYALSVQHLLTERCDVHLPRQVKQYVTVCANYLCSLKPWDRGFESHLRHGYLCLRLVCVSVVLCVGRGLVTG
jgi:prenyltransferase beta subunit